MAPKWLLPSQPPSSVSSCEVVGLRLALGWDKSSALALIPQSGQKNAGAGEQNAADWLAYSMSSTFVVVSPAYHKAMQSPQMAFVSKQLTLVLLAQTQYPRVDPLLPRLVVRLFTNAAAPCASAVAETLGRAIQLRKLSGLPRTTETTTKARRSSESIMPMTKRPRLAWA